MTILRAMVTIPRDTAIPKDAVTNTWHFNTDGAIDPETAAGLLHARLFSFYGGGAGSGTVGGLLSKALNGDGARLKVYDLSDAQPRTPIHDEPMAIAVGTNDPHPAEVAIVLSFHSAFASGVTKARRRGRIYLGPVNTSMNQFVNSDLFIDSTSRGIVTAAAAALVADDTAALKWAVHSVTDNTAHAPVVGGWVDNAYDTQRRRGPAPTARTTFGTG